MGTESKAAITELLLKWDDYQLIQLSKFYRNRLEQAIEEDVEGVSFLLTYKGHISGKHHQEVVNLREKETRADGSKLLLSLVMEKDPHDYRLIWKYFLKMHHILPKMNALLKEMQELDVQEKHKETLRAQTETLRVNTILMKEKVKVFQLVDRYAELTVVSALRDLRLVEHELLARGQKLEAWREKHTLEELKKIRTEQLFQSSCSQSKYIAGNSVAVAGIPGIGKTTMVQKIVYDWATGQIYQHFQFVFAFKFRDLNSIKDRMNLRELVLDRYPYLGNILGAVWNNPEGLLFIFDGLDEFKHRIDFADSRRDTEPQHMCPDPEWRCEVSDIVYSLIQHKLLPGCSVLVTTRPTALHLLEKAEISVWAEILGFAVKERKKYFHRFFEDQAVVAAVLKHLEENDILYTMSYNPSYCWILGLALGPFFTQRHRDPQLVPKTITQLYSHYIYNILKNHGREIESPRDVLLMVGQMASTGLSEKKVVFTEGDLITYNLQPSQFLSGFLMELMGKEDSARSAVFTFPHLFIQEFVAALALFLKPHPGDIPKQLTEFHSTTDGRFEVLLRFVAGLSSPGSSRGLDEFLGPFSNQTICQVIDWVKEEFKVQIGNPGNEAGKRSLLNTLHYLFEAQNSALVQAALGSVENLSFCNLPLSVSDCTIISRAIRFCDRIKCLDLWGCYICYHGLQRLEWGLHKFQELRLGNNQLGDSAVKLVSAALRNKDCKIQKLDLGTNGLTASCAEDLTSALRTNRSLRRLGLSGNKLEDSGVKHLLVVLQNPNCNIQELRLHSNGLTSSCAEVLAATLRSSPSLTEIDLGGNKLADSGMKHLCSAMRNPNCKLQKLRLGNGRIGDSCSEELASALSTVHTLKRLDLKTNFFTDQSVPALQRLMQTHPSLERINMEWNRFSTDGRKRLKLLNRSKAGLKIHV